MTDYVTSWQDFSEAELNKIYTLHSLQKRILAVITLISFIFCGLIVRLFVIQIINGKSLQSKATSQWTRDLSIVAPRGTIYDRTGSALAVSYTTYNLYARGREVRNPSETAQGLSEILNLNFTNIYEKITQKGISEVLIKMNLDSEIAEKIYTKNYSGIYLAESVSRYYPYGNLLSQLLGFTSIDNVGQSGIESYFNKTLSGENGYSFTQSDLQGKEIGGSLRYYIPATKGEDLTLTIDSKIQLILEQVLQKAYNEQKAKAVTGIVMSVKTGEILAMSTKPSFDLNNIPRNDISTLFEQSKIKAVTDVYEPGSTFKILTLAIALETGVCSLEDHFYCPGYRVIDGVRIKCWRSIGHGSQTLAEGFANSCNCVFMDLALRIGVDNFYKYIQSFGLGQKTGLSVSGEASGILMNKSSVKTVDLARIGFGHAIAVTPIQLLTVVCGIMNGGMLKTPILTSSQESNDKYSIISKETSQTMNTLLEKATNKQGDFTFVEGYNVGGKTGTAQKYAESGSIAQGKYISSFVGTYPANDPEYALIIMVDEPSAGAYYGSVVAAPYGKDIFRGIFEYKGIKKDSETTSLVYVDMPDVTNITLTDALITLKKLGLHCEIDGEGGVIKKQLPPEGTKLAVGDTIILIT